MERLSYSWEDDPVSATLIEKMQISGVIELEAKEYLRPIFKWTKQGSKSYNIDRANAFAEYLVTIAMVINILKAYLAWMELFRKMFLLESPTLEIATRYSAKAFARSML